MGIFVTLKNVDRVPGLVVRVKNIDTIEIDVEPLQPYEVCVSPRGKEVQYAHEIDSRRVVESNVRPSVMA